MSQERKRPHQAQVTILRHVEENPGRRVWIDTLVELTGANKASIQAVMGRLVDHGQAEVIARGNCWQIARADGAVGTLYSQIGQTRDGHPVLQHEDGRLFVAREVK